MEKCRRKKEGYLEGPGHVPRKSVQPNASGHEGRWHWPGLEPEEGVDKQRVRGRAGKSRVDAAQRTPWEQWEATEGKTHL